MKIRTIPKEYEAIIFDGITKQVESFVGDRARIYKHGDGFVLSDFIGNHGLDIGDYLYKTDSPITMIHIAHNGKIFSEYFEIID